MDINEVTSTGEYSGSGMFSEVYIMPDGEAIKVCNDANSDAWLWWAIIAMENPDLPFLPNIRSIHINIHKNTFVAKMEALNDVEDIDISQETYEKAYPFFEQCEAICPFNLVNDTGQGSWNWMEADDGREIFTDPFCYRGWSDLKDNDDDRTLLVALEDYLYDNPVEGITFEGRSI